MLIDRPIALNDETFARTIAESDVPVLVDFYADWCGPCKIMAPSVDQLARENQGKLLVAKLDTDRVTDDRAVVRHSRHPDDDRVQGGKEAKRVTGAVPLRALQAIGGSVAEIGNQRIGE